jgi:PKD repeat protein
MSGDTVSPAEITFTSTSTNADSLGWDFGNGHISNLSNTRFTFEESGTYEVNLVAYQLSTGRTDTARQSLSISPSRVQFLYLLVEAMPLTGPGGNPWDIGSGPDVYAVLYESEIAFWTSSTQFDILPEHFPLLFAVGNEFIFTDFSAVHRIQFSDDDVGGFSQVIGNITFTYQDFIDEFGYEDEVVVQGVPVNLRVRVGFRWI